MFKKVLVANRGEIAVRIIRALREMDIKSVAVYSEADEDSMHAHLADEAVCIGPARATGSYLNMANIISAADLTGADAIHPGFGFLSENSKFADMCRECEIEFIGPDAEMIDMMGNKSKAREIMIDAKVPVVPGSDGVVEDVEKALKLSKEIGYPIMIKASSGGGGRGMRLCKNDEELLKNFKTASAEAEAAFGDGSMYMEKFIENPRHIEFQILGDKHGNVVHLWERDCSMQRRNQKVIEEAPSMLLTEETRERMGEAAIKAAKAVNYHSAGTVEFLVDKTGDFYFIEMNTRIQVEHPVTEMITGIDLIKQQIEVAYGEKLKVTQENIKIEGHAIECRINAENPAKNFMPCPGKIETLNMPGGNGVRVDSHIYQGYKVPSSYDSMILKLIVHGENRDSAISKMKRALRELVVEGIETNIEFQESLISNEDFRTGNFDTGFIERKQNKGEI